MKNDIANTTLIKGEFPHNLILISASDIGCLSKNGKNIIAMTKKPMRKPAKSLMIERRRTRMSRLITLQKRFISNFFIFISSLCLFNSCCFILDHGFTPFYHLYWQTCCSRDLGICITHYIEGCRVCAVEVYV